MKPGIFYLYEYNNSQKLRNAGFLKITLYYRSCTLMLNARGIPVAYSDTIKLCAFYLENDLTNSSVLAEITCTNHAFSARLNSAESRFPEGHTLDTIDGFFLPLPNGHILAAAAPGIAVDPKKLLAAPSNHAAPEKEPGDDSPSSDNSSDTFMGLEAESLQECGTDAPAEPDPIDSEPESCESTAPPEQNASAEQESPDEQDVPFEQECSPEPDNAPESECSPEQCTPAESSSCDEQSPVMEQPPHSGQNPAAEQPSQSGQNPAAEQPSQSGQNPAVEQPSCDTQTPNAVQPSCDTQTPNAVQPSHDAQNPSAQQPSCGEQGPSQNQDSSAKPTAPTQTVKKIQRSEMSILPRKYWHLANNSFLLHGYHNYHHLLLIEKDGHYWLGVPGIYDPREARAARLFGFPQFTDSYNDSLQLTDDECNPQENFGYWCCFLK